ncbi:hypothetical protein JX265_001807 [Neoarthrinium moseri]|uniref:Uncharacterized protein n=1 Tax=Neoarthrinium moseri TaxID=1658444 RepID=A0A9Q0AVG0_9PEZI|nr:hypothetical protein JX265_001807 [Neoarthrinium moseri]
MQFRSASFQTLAIVLLAVPSVFADMHYAATCIGVRQGGTYEILANATECACTAYLNRNTGDKQYDTCPDCTFDGMQCNSADWHIGGDEWNYYCEDKCGARGSVAN